MRTIAIFLILSFAVSCGLSEQEKRLKEAAVLGASVELAETADYNPEENNLKITRLVWAECPNALDYMLRYAAFKETAEACTDSLERQMITPVLRAYEEADRTQYHFRYVGKADYTYGNIYGEKKEGSRFLVLGDQTGRDAKPETAEAFLAEAEKEGKLKTIR